MPSSLRSACLALSLCGSVAGAQTLAHPGWRGNGIASEAWWKHTAFVRLRADTSLQQAAEAMQAMSQAGADSMILPDLLPTGSAQLDAEGVAHPFDSKFGTEDDLDALLREASARHMHVLLRTNLLRLMGTPGEVRFWMSRGVAGFDAGDVPPAQMDTLQLLRGAMDRFPGQRVLLAHTPAASSGARHRLDPVTLHLVAAGEFDLRAGSATEAVEIDSANALKTAPANTALVVGADLLANEATRDDLRRLLATRSKHPRPYSGGRAGRRRSR